MPIKISRNVRFVLAAFAILIVIGLAGFGLTRYVNANATKTSPSDGKLMVRVSAGEFRMGTSAAQEADLVAKFSLQPNVLSGEMPQATVTLPEFYIDQTVVTNAEYKKFIDANPNHAVPFLDNALANFFNWDKATRKSPAGREQEPVVLVTWADGVAYCKWAGKRLPTEAEWEKAARGTDERIWPWGNESDLSKVSTVEPSKGEATPSPHLTSAASPYGALDMVGYILQWTASLDKAYPYDAKDGREDPNASGMRITRGSSRLFSISGSRTAIRNRFDPNGVSLSIGFRCAQ